MDSEEFLAKILRHSATEDGLTIHKGGYISFKDLYFHKPQLKITKEMITKSNRFQITECGSMIRALQGHTIDYFIGKEEELGMKRITNFEDSVCVHGTYIENLNTIKNEGINRMRRVHIHMSNKYVSNKKFDFYVYIDAQKCINDGIPFYRTLNDVIVSPGPIPPQYIIKIESVMQTFPCIIEVSAGSRNKYEYDHNSGRLVLDRVLHSACFYPYDYGFIPDTLCGDGDPLDILVMNTSPLVPGCMVYIRPLGYLIMEDEKGRDEKVLAVSSKDPHWNDFLTLEDVPKHKLMEITQFFQTYKALEKNKWVKVEGWKGTEDTYKLINDCENKYFNELKKKHFK